jgi:hypothetical protein
MSTATQYDVLVRLVAARLADAELDHTRRIGHAGDDIRAGGIPILRSPSWDELIERRGETTPCSTACKRCTRCRIARGYQARRLAKAASWG